MLAIGHTAVGFGVGLIITNNIHDPVLATIIVFFLGIILHYLTDLIPHGHLTVKLKDPYDSHSVYLDIFGGGLLFTMATYLSFGISPTSLIILFSMFSNVLPDFFRYFIKREIVFRVGLFKIEDIWHEYTHWHGHGEDTLPLGWYDIWQFIVVLGSLALPVLIRG